MAARGYAVLIPGAWVTAQSWAPLARRLEARGITCIAPDWPYKDRAIAALRASPDPRLATLGLDELVEHYARHVRACAAPPLLIGHSLGGLVAQLLLDRDLGRGAIALCPAPPRGILPLHASVVRATAPLLARPFGWRRIARLAFADWQRDYAGSLPGHEQRAIYDQHVVPESGRIWYQLAGSLIGGAGEVAFRNRERRPLLLVAGDEDRVTPAAMILANQRAYVAPTELHVLEGRGHWVLAEHDADELAGVVDRFAAPLWDAPARRAPLRAPTTGALVRRVVIIGAGPAGLATGAALARRGVDSVILERATDAGQSWRGHYDRLRLHTTRSLSGLPGLAIPRAWGGWVAAHDFASYLERYARHHQLAIATETAVHRVAREPRGRWTIESSRGTWRADHVVVAAGLNRRPALPAWATDAGPDRFAGPLIHASAYRGPAAYRGRDVLVVGTGNSGAEIAADLAAGGAARVRLAVRTGPNLLPRSLLGVPTQVTGVVFGALPPRAMDLVMRGMQRLLFGDVTRLGLPRPDRGLFTQLVRDRAVPIIDVGLVAALAAGTVEPVAAVEAVAGGRLRLADGTTIAPDAVIAATGYRADLGPLLGAAIALDDDGLPRVSAAGAVAGAPGLYCAGYLVSAGGVLRAIARQAERIAAAIAETAAAAPNATVPAAPPGAAAGATTP